MQRGVFGLSDTWLPNLQVTGGPAPPPVTTQTALLAAASDAVPQLVSANVTGVTTAPGGGATNATLLIGTGHPAGTFTPQVACNSMGIDNKHWLHCSSGGAMLLLSAPGRRPTASPRRQVLLGLALKSIHSVGFQKCAALLGLSGTGCARHCAAFQCSLTSHPWRNRTSGGAAGSGTRQPSCR